MPIINKAPKRPDPARTLVLSFLAIIAVGTLLLWLPISSKSGEFTSVSDCVFTATSATCVTGLAVVDTYLHWSLFGQIVIALLVQVGGLGFVTIITFFNLAIGKKVGYHSMRSAAGEMTENGFEGGRPLLISIIKYSVIIELCGAIVLAPVFVTQFGGYGVWVSLFMSIMAFNNAGFDLMGMQGEFSSVTCYQDNPAVLITLALLITMGGLGFVVWDNLLNLKTRKKLSLHTKAVLAMFAILTASGTVFYLISEWNNPATLGEMGVPEKVLNAFFSSVTTRTAGFECIPTSEMTEFSRLGTIALMFVGAAPGSTGGGIKVTTLLVMVMTVVAYLTNKNDVEIFRHKIDKLTVYRTVVTTTLSLAAVTICFTALYLSVPEEHNSDVGAVHCLFDAVSAFSTTGLSCGATALAGTVGKILLIFTMFIGRVGPVSIILSIVMKNVKRKSIVVPDGNIMIG